MTISAFRPNNPDGPGRSTPPITGEVGLRPRARRAEAPPPPVHPWPIRQRDADPQPAAPPVIIEVDRHNDPDAATSIGELARHPGPGVPTIVGEVGLHPMPRPEVIVPPAVRPVSLRRGRGPVLLPNAAPITGEVALHPTPRPTVAPPFEPWFDRPSADEPWERRLRSIAPLAPTAPRRQAPPAPEAEPEPLWKRTLSLLFTLAILAMLVLLWPARLGGSTRLVIVMGDSMEPTYSFGDLVVTRDQGSRDVGDVVVFAVPDGSAKGILVIHRLTEVGDDGVHRTQGDNRDRPDSWDLTEDDLIGTPLLSIPKGGYIVWYLQQWWVVGIVVGLLAIFLLWPDQDEIEEFDEESDHTVEPRTRGGRIHAAVVDDTELIARILIRSEDTIQLPRTTVWSETPIADDVMMDAIAWLDEQLELLGHSTTG